MMSLRTENLIQVLSKFMYPLFQYSTIPVFQLDLSGGSYGIRI